MMLLYAVPILVTAWFCSKGKGLVVAAMSAICWLLANSLANPAGASEIILSWNALSRFGLFSMLAYTVSLQIALKKALENEKQNARTDRLTNLFNKWAFMEQCEHELARANRYRHAVSLAFIDIDNFKSINDSQGHAQGDRLLMEIGVILRETVRKEDVVGRIGGDEFAICFPETGSQTIRTVIEKLIKDVSSISTRWHHQVTVSIGVVSYDEGADSFDSIIKKADSLMFTAKQNGKNNAEYLCIVKAGNE